MANKTHMGIGAVIALLVAAYLGLDLSESKQQTNTFVPSAEVAIRQQTNVQKSTHKLSDDTQRIEQAYQHRQSDLQVQASGKVVVLLKDDNEGSRHQKFILELSTGQTVLVAHNIDLAPRIQNIQNGDQVVFFGEYEYSDKGGVIHWTHHDPSNKHISGWLKHQGKTYQ